MSSGERHFDAVDHPGLAAHDQQPRRDPDVERRGAYLAESYVDRLPNASIGKSCVRFKRTSDVDLDTMRELIAEAARLGPPYEAAT